MDSSVTNNLVIGTFNVKNVETNILFTNKLLKKVDILFLQETWLFNFQLPLLQEYFSSHIHVGKQLMMRTRSHPHRNLEDMEVWLVW